VTDSDPDAQEMLAAGAGDVAAFTRLVERWVRPLAGFFRRLGADGATAEDCAQDVFLKLYRTRAAYEPRARFSTYLFSIARHHWIDQVRHRAAGPRTVSSEGQGADGGDASEGPGASLVSGVTDPGELAQRDEAVHALRRVVARLDPEQREILALTRGEGLRYQEIARILGIPVGTVKSRVHNVLRLLREALRREGFEP